MKAILIAIGVLIVGYVAYAVSYPTYSYRYKVTIEVETSEGLKVGSSVLEVRTIQYPQWLTLGANGSHTTVRGEAAFVDLGSIGNLVSILSLGPNVSDDRVQLFAPRSFFSLEEGRVDSLSWSKRLSEMTGERRPFAGDKSPTLVTFTDLSDPASIRSVPFTNPGEVLGPKVQSVRSWIELTSEPVTWKLKERIPWIDIPEAAEKAIKVLSKNQWNRYPMTTLFRRNEH